MLIPVYLVYKPVCSFSRLTNVSNVFNCFLHLSCLSIWKFVMGMYRKCIYVLYVMYVCMYVCIVLMVVIIVKMIF